MITLTDDQIWHLMQHATADKRYQDILYMQQLYEADFRRILRSLSEQDQFYLKMYIKVRSAAERRVTHTAYFLEPIENDP